MKMEFDLAQGKLREYRNYPTLGEWFYHANAVGKINNEKSTMPFDSGAKNLDHRNYLCS